jgi:hypothetical protein
MGRKFTIGKNDYTKVLKKMKPKPLKYTLLNTGTKINASKRTSVCLLLPAI